MINNDLVARIGQCPNLPSLPTIAIEVLDLTSKADVDIVELAATISKDPALTTKILKTVNSSFYGRSQNVSTIRNALVVLGLQSVKTLVLGFSLVSNLSKRKKEGFNHLRYWRRSIYAATAARTLASKMQLVQQEEAFLAALLQDIGMLVLDQVLEKQYSEICEKSPTHAELVSNEAAELGMTHAEVGELLTTQWKLPPILTTCIGASHNCDAVTDSTLRKLSVLIHLASYCADVFVDEHAAGAIAQVRSFAAKVYKLSDGDCDALLQEIGDKTKEVAKLFELNIGPAANYENVLKKANEALVQLTLESQMQASQLKEQNVVLKVQATTDRLTGLNNRGRFDEFLGEHFQNSLAASRPLTLLLMDVDKFKSVNDRFGHQAGDQVLAVLGKILRNAARPQDLASRYGGEELAIILPDTTRAAGATIAETLRRAVASTPIQSGKVTLSVTISIGVATVEPGSPFKLPEHLLKAADMAVYNAKKGGRNCVKIFSFKAAA
jgi:two-component system, cell cycle response regulator